MGNCLVGQGRIKEALEAYFKAVEIKPNYAAAYNNMGIALKGFVFDEHNFALHTRLSSHFLIKKFMQDLSI